jgi:membrane-associated protease RseP (regulator of RpoE activity)
MIFNLLPGYPLDGGHTLDAWLGALFGPTWATRVVSALGLVIAALIGLWAFSNAQFFMLFVAFFIGQANWDAWQSVGRWRR